MQFHDFPTGINNSPLVKSVFVKRNNSGDETPPADEGFLLLSGANFELLNGSQFLLLEN
jgi:hypothetical protein